MKIFRIHPLGEATQAAARPLHNKISASPFLEKKDVAPDTCPPYALLTLPDTALTDRGRPFFVPDFAAPCRVEAFAAFRVGRLGRFVAPRFAHRYLDALTVVAAFSAPALAEKLLAAGHAPDMAYAFDGSICRGTWHEIDPSDDAPRLRDDMSLVLNGSTALSGSTPHPDDVDRALAFVSSVCKIADGDILLVPLDLNPAHGGTVEAQPEEHIEGFLGSERLLAFNVK